MYRGTNDLGSIFLSSMFWGKFVAICEDYLQSESTGHFKVQFLLHYNFPKPWEVLTVECFTSVVARKNSGWRT